MPRVSVRDGLERLEANITALRDLIDERDRRYAERDAANKAAIGKAEDAQHAYNNLHNDLLRRLDQQSKEMIGRIEFGLALKSLESGIADLRSSRDTGAGRDTATDTVRTGQRWIVGTAISSFLTLLGLTLHVVLE